MNEVSNMGLPEGTGQTGPMQEEDGFTMVKRGGRNSVQPARQFTFKARGERGVLEKSKKAIPNNTSTEEIKISNVFERLGDNLSMPGIREDIMEQGEDKENKGNEEVGPRLGDNSTLEIREDIMEQNIENEEVGPKGFTKENILRKGGGNIRGPIEKEKITVSDKFAAKTNIGGRGAREGNKEGRYGRNKFLGKNGPKNKQGKVNKPTRELVFGPVSNEMEISLSSSGKRLRVEEKNVGRHGGPFMVEHEPSVEDITLGSSKVEVIGNVSSEQDETLMAENDGMQGESLTAGLENQST